MQELAKEGSQHVYQLVEEQYGVANDRKTHYTIRPGRAELLPCRHVMYWWLISNKTPIPMQHIHPHWCLTYPLNIPINDASRHKVLNGTNKFRTTYYVGCCIADNMSRNGTSVYLKMLEALRSFEDAVNDGDVP
ncbi:hypothetical protein JG688_00015527 [Phytophthora aleatoria]|uniref:Uncharacterized protein n=1 Tax=Phytophthora aleatoria TaxID=2496075 RepID=A0A8J5IHN9_9STRA|nr:hypothetical protein JG688_00015527 [Phytophthora aleatoria]